MSSRLSWGKLPLPPAPPIGLLYRSGHVLLGLYKGVKTQPQSLCLFVLSLFAVCSRWWIILVVRWWLEFAEDSIQNKYCVNNLTFVVSWINFVVTCEYYYRPSLTSSTVDYNSSSWSSPSSSPPSLIVAIIVCIDHHHLCLLSPSPKIIRLHHVIGVGTDLHLIFGSRSAGTTWCRLSLTVFSLSPTHSLWQYNLAGPSRTLLGLSRLSPLLPRPTRTRSSVSRFGPVPV